MIYYIYRKGKEDDQMSKKSKRANKIANLIIKSIAAVAALIMAIAELVKALK